MSWRPTDQHSSYSDGDEITQEKKEKERESEAIKGEQKQTNQA